MSGRLPNKDDDEVEVKTVKSADDADKSFGRSLSPAHKQPKDHRDRRRSRSPHHRRRSHSRERRRSRSRDKERRRHNDSSKHSSRRYSPERTKDDDRGRYKQSHYRRRRSRSSSTERHEREHEKNKLEMRQQLARNYEEQIEKMKHNQYGPPSQINHKYPNQVHVEPSKLVEQIEKRKFLFKKDKPAETTTSTTAVWKNTAFTDDSDGKMSAKFKRLMGMKESAAAAASGADDDSVKKHDEYFANLEKQYEVARATTHTQRGLGLGFSSGGRIFPVNKP